MPCNSCRIFLRIFLPLFLSIDVAGYVCIYLLPAILFVYIFTCLINYLCNYLITQLPINSSRTHFLYTFNAGGGQLGRNEDGVPQAVRLHVGERAGLAGTHYARVHIEVCFRVLAY